MIFRDLLADTLRTLWSHKRRTALSMFGIAWGIVSMILLVASIEGLREGQRRRMESFGKDILIIHAGRTSLQAGGQRAGRELQWQDADYLHLIGQSPSCRYVMPELGRGDVPVRSHFNNASPLVTGSLPEFAAIRSVEVAEGRFYNAEDVAVARRVAFLGTEVAEQLFAGRAAVGETVHIGAFPYTVIGVMRRKTQNSSYDGWDVRKVFVPFSTILRDFPQPPPATPHDIDRLLVTPKSDADHLACKAQVLRGLGRLHDFDPADKEAASVWDTVENARHFHQIIDGMRYFLGAVGLTTLLLGGIGVMNVMLVAVRERTREIGLRMAVGATSSAILRQFFVETAIIVFLSGALGLGAGYGFCALVNTLPMPEFFAGMLAGWAPGLVAFGMLGAIALAAAMYPAGQAAAVDPIEALRHEAGG